MEGPLGVGKSTLAAALRDHYQSTAVKMVHTPEAVDVWRNWCDEDVLQRAIVKADNLFFFQTLVQYTYNIDMTKAIASGADVVVVERSPLSSIGVFGNMAASKGRITPGEYQLLQKVQGVFGEPLDHVVGLWGHDLEALHARVLQRDDQKANREWTQEVYEAYEAFFKTTLPTCGVSYDIVSCMLPPGEVVGRVVAIIDALLKK